VRVIDPSTSFITTISGTPQSSGYSIGDGGNAVPALSVKMNIPQGVFGDSQGGVYVVDNVNCVLQRLTVVPVPSLAPSLQPSGPSLHPSRQPVVQPSSQPSTPPSSRPSSQPIGRPSTQPTYQPTGQPIALPSSQPSSRPSQQPSNLPSLPTYLPTPSPSIKNTLSWFNISTVAGRFGSTTSEGDGGRATSATFGLTRGACFHLFF
jgi:hypothetical protein